MTQSARFDRSAVIWRKATSSDPEYTAPNSQYESIGGGWVPLDGYEVGSPTTPKRMPVNRMDLDASRDEGVALGAVIGRTRTRLRCRWRNDVDSSMKVTIYGDGTPEEFQIVAGPIEYGGRKEQLQMILEKYTTT